MPAEDDDLPSQAVPTTLDEHEEEVVEAEKKMTTSKSFTKKPLSSLQDWKSIMRKGQDFSHTPMGLVCLGKFLLEGHPYFVRPADGGGAAQICRRLVKLSVDDEDEVASDEDIFAGADDVGDVVDDFDNNELKLV